MPLKAEESTPRFQRAFFVFLSMNIKLKTEKSSDSLHGI
jgi:hypothetical protein